MARLIPLSDITTRHADALGNDYCDHTRTTAYGTKRAPIGPVAGALVGAVHGRHPSRIVGPRGGVSY